MGIENACVGIDTEGLRGSPEDILVWPNGFFWCYRDDEEELAARSADFYVLYEGTPEWEEFKFTEEGPPAELVGSRATRLWLCTMEERDDCDLRYWCSVGLRPYRFSSGGCVYLSH